MKGYIYKRNKDGVHYMDISKTWEKLMVAARVIAAAQSKNLKDVLVSYCFKSQSKQRLHRRTASAFV
jgi:ribosomal protein S2